MKLLKDISDLFNVIEPWLVVIVFIFQIATFFIITKRKMKTAQLSGDILNNVLEKIKVSLENKEKKEDKKKVIKDAIQIESKK